MDPGGDILLQTSRFDILRVVRTSPDGTVRSREIVRHPGAVTILPVLDDQRVCLIQNYRVSVERTLIELPAGTLESGEDPRVAAERELAEETGFRAERLTPLHAFWLSPGILDERMHLYLATGLRSGPVAREPGEEIENLIVDWDQALRWVDDGTIQDAKTLAALLFYHRRRSKCSTS